MEEFVGGLWDKLVTRAASHRHPEAAVRLDEISKSAGILFRALGGDPGLNLSAAPALRHGARCGPLAVVGDGRGARYEGPVRGLEGHTASLH